MTNPSHASTPTSTRVIFWCLASSLAGFLFGFDTVVISGAEKTIQQLWGLTPGAHGFAMSSALWGTVIGALFGGFPTDRFGRRKTLLSIGFLYLVSAIWSALAQDVTSFIIARSLGGVGIGISTVASPLYIAEISPPNRRGRLAGLFQFNIVFGILVAYLSNYLIGNSVNPENSWRWMLGVEALPAIVYFACCFTLPESPRWLISRGSNETEARRIFRLIQPQASEAEIDAQITAIRSGSSPNPPQKRSAFSTHIRKPLVLAFLIAFFNQLSGINAILYFAPRIFEWTGLGQQAALLQSVGIGVTNLIFTFVGLTLIDRLGRRTLLILGSLGYIISLGGCAWAFASENYFTVPYFIFAFIAAHAIGQGAVIWVFISEIFPNRSRAMGQSVGCGTHWIFAALLTSYFPKMAELLSPSLIFGFFCAMMIL
ncbi:MAG: sugar porter family MFS transporter, partial [Verrucomicrobiales bacterium]